MKKIFFVTLALAGLVGVGMASKVATVWTSLYFDNASSTEYASACVLDSNGKIYAVGTRSLDGSANSYDLLVVKYNADTGDTLWTRSYNGSYSKDDRASGCAIDDSGYIYVVGSSYGSVYDNYITLKLNPLNGDTIWTRRYESPYVNNDHANSCVFDNGFLYVTGSSIIKYNASNGDTVWTRRIINDAIGSITSNNAGQLFITGITASNTRVWARSINSNGDSLWARLDSTNSSAENCIYVNDTLYVIGNAISGAGGNVTKYSKTGQLISNVNYPNLGWPYSVAVDKYGNQYIPSTKNFGVNNDIYTMAIKQNGDTLWSAVYNGPTNNNDAANNCALDNLRNVYVCGSANNGTNNDFVVIKYRDVLAQVELMEPLDGALFTVSTPSFKWFGDDSATTYRLQISPFSNFSSLTVNQLTADTFLTSTVLPNNWYFWRVKAYSATDSSEWSEVRSFSISTTTMGIPALTFPPADTVTNDSFPDFDWSDVAGATQYQLQVGKGNSWLYASYSSYGIRVVNISDINNTEYLHNASLYNIIRLQIKDTLLLAASGSGVYITKIDNPYTMTHLSTYSRASYDVAVRDTLMYVASQNQGLRVVNIANLSSPAEVAACDSTTYTRALELLADRAYMLAGGYLKVVDIANPAAPAILGTLPLANAVDLVVSGNYVYTASGNTGLQVVDVSNPAAPVLQGSCYTDGNFRRLKVRGDYAYVAASYGGMRVINIANPANPVEFGHYQDDLSPEDVALTGQYACISGDGENARMIDITDPYSPVLAADVMSNTHNCDAIAINDSFAAVEMDTVLAPSACPADTFVGDGRHYWRARAGAGTWGQYSAARRFIMDTQPPWVPTLQTPGDQALINTPSPYFLYSTAGGYRYRFQVARDTGFTVIEADTIAPAPNCTLKTVLGDGHHYWRGRAMDLAGNWSDWSGRFMFRLDSKAPGAPLGITANGASPSPWTKVNSFSVSFTAPFDSTGVERYFYKKGAAPSSNYDTTYYGMAWSPPINETALGTGTTQFYVWARDTAGNLDYRNYATVSLRYDSIPPEGTIARSNEFSRTSNFTVSWNAGGDQGGSGLNNRYWIKLKVNGGVWTDLNTNYAGTSYIHSGVQGSKYFFEVAALDSAGNSEAFSGAAECSTLVDNTITSPILVSPYNGAIRDSAITHFLWQRATTQAGSRLQCSYNAAFTALAKDTLLAADSLANLTLADSLYYWRVRGQNSGTDTSVWSPARTLRIDTQAPAAPALAAPSADSLLNDNTPQFSWGAVAGASNYELMISPDSLFAASAVDETIDTTAYTIQVPLPDSAYYWKAKAGDAAGNWSAWSARRKFTVDTKAPPVPNLLLPASGDTSKTNLPGFAWNSSAQAVQYRLQVANNPSFSPVEMDTLCSDTSAVPLWGINDGTHYWRVRCRDLAGNWSAYSAYRNLVIAGLLQVALITPDTGSLWAPSQSVWIQFSKAIYTASGNIDTTKFKIRGKHSPIVRSANLSWEPATSTMKVTPDTAFAANDTITVLVSGTLRDYQNIASSTLDGNNDGIDTGDSTDSYQMTFRTSFIGDYNGDGLMNGPDLALFAGGWQTYGRYFEAGPFFGSWPHQKIYVGSATKLDFEDLMGLVYSWNQSGAAKSWPAKTGDPGPLALECSPDQSRVTVKVKPGTVFSALDVSIAFDPAAGAGKVTASELWSSEGNPQLFLTRQVPGLTQISAAVWPGSSQTTDELFRFSLSETKGQIPVSLSYRLYDRSGEVLAEGSLATAVEILPGLPAVFSFSPARPNPAGQTAAVSYQLPSESAVKLEIFNIAGQRVATLADGRQPAGYYQKTWNLKDNGGRRVSNGVYLFRLTAGADRGTGKIVVIR